MHLLVTPGTAVAVPALGRRYVRHIDRTTAALMVKRYGEDAMLEAADLSAIILNLDDPEFLFARF